MTSYLLGDHCIEASTRCVIVVRKPDAVVTVSDKQPVFQLSFMGQLSIPTRRRGVMGGSHIVVEEDTISTTGGYPKMCLLPKLSGKKVVEVFVGLRSCFLLSTSHWI